MDKKLLIFGLVLFGIIGMSGTGSAIGQDDIMDFNATWTAVTPSVTNGTIPANDAGNYRVTSYILANDMNVFFNITVCNNATAGNNMTAFNITLPVGFTYISNSNGTNLTSVGALVINFTNNTQNGRMQLNWNGSDQLPILNITQCGMFWFNATVASSGGAKTFNMNATANSTSWGHANWTLAGIYVDTQSPAIDLNTTNNSWFRDTTPALYFNVTDDVTNITFNCTIFVDGLSSGTNATSQRNTPTGISVNRTLTAGNHSWFVNCTDNLSNGNTSSGIQKLFIHSSALVTSWYTTNGSDTELAYPDTHAVLANNTVNFYVTMNTSGGWNATVKAWNNSHWTNVTILYGYTDGTTTSAKIRISSENFDDDAINLSTSTNKTLKIFISNKTSTQVQVLEVGVWTNMLVVSTNVDTLAVGTETEVYYNITDWKGTAIAGYMNYTPTAIVNETYAGGGYNLQVYEAQSANHRPITPKYVQNLSFFPVNSSGHEMWGSGNLSVNKTLSVGQGSISAASIVTTSNPTNIYKFFGTNVTVNITLLNETIVDYDSYAVKNINVTIFTSPMNYSRNETNNTAGQGTFCNITFTNDTVNDFRNVTASGDVSLDVTVLIDVNRDGLWDYNTSVTGEKTISDAAELVILSVSPTSQNISAGTVETVIFTVKNQSNMDTPYNITISSSDTKLYNGSITATSTALATYTQGNDTADGKVTLEITAEQNGTIDVTISASGLTSVTDSIKVLGSLIDRDSISSTLGTKMVYNESYTIQVPVKTRAGLADYGAQVNVSGSSYVAATTVGQNISGTSGGYTLYSFNIRPVVTGYLNITVFGGDNNNATVMNAYEVAFIRNYTVEATYGGATVTSLTEGLNNTINLTVKEGTDLNSGALTVTYYNSTQSGSTYLGSQVTLASVSNMTSIGLDVPKTATSVVIEVSNTTESKSG
ncbi:MAG: hypothetical protein L6247_06260, partial [Desulfobacteraceae bacterium]|nr:hypothetical protein [Desulfobacteraceae bacterium]